MRLRFAKRLPRRVWVLFWMQLFQAKGLFPRNSNASPSANCPGPMRSYPALLKEPPLRTSPLTGMGPRHFRPPDLVEFRMRSEEHTSELQSHLNLVCRLLLEKKKNKDSHE